MQHQLNALRRPTNLEDACDLAVQLNDASWCMNNDIQSAEAHDDWIKDIKIQLTELTTVLNRWTQRTGEKQFKKLLLDTLEPDEHLLKLALAGASPRRQALVEVDEDFVYSRLRDIEDLSALIVASYSRSDKLLLLPWWLSAFMAEADNIFDVALLDGDDEETITAACKLFDDGTGTLNEVLELARAL